LRPFTQRRARAYLLLSRRGGVDVLLSIADAREPLDVRYRGNPEDICLHRVVLSLTPSRIGVVRRPTRFGRFAAGVIELTITPEGLL
jgi:hypothetical protein